MGNHSSRSDPTQEDYGAYFNDLKELQAFLNEKFVAGHLRSGVADNEFDAQYLDALKIKLRQLRNVRRHVMSRRGRRARNVPPTMMRLLDALEPQCQRAVDELSHLQAGKSSSTSDVQTVTSSDARPVCVSTSTDEMTFDLDVWFMLVVSVSLSKVKVTDQSSKSKENKFFFSYQCTLRGDYTF